MSPTTPSHHIATGMAVGLEYLPNLKFRANKPYRACLICGTVYQTDADRAIEPNSSIDVIAQAKERRDLWAVGHAKEHSNKAHNMLRVSGMMMTPEAAHKLAAFGLISVTDMIMVPEISNALFESSAIPVNDAVDK